MNGSTSAVPDKAKLERWAKRLAASSSLALPTDYPRPSPAKLVEAIQEYDVPTSVLERIETLASSTSASRDEIVLSAFSALLHRFTPDPSLAIALDSEAGSPTFSLCILDFSNEKGTFQDIVGEVLKKKADAAEDAISLEHLSSLASEGPLFRVRYGHVGVSLTTDLTLRYVESSKQWKVAYNSLLFSQARILHMLASLSQLLLNVQPDSAVASVNLRTPEQEKILPDPTADLDWCGYKGAITDIFQANAGKHPDKPCVIQCLPTKQDLSASVASIGSNAPQAERLTFTYQQIDRASNVLAHSLLKAGVERGEVVMVYAARSVEMVCCVMGILKAGAVFSVIDPAYPPNRQNIYLSVSTPRALLVIASAGNLHPDVQQYIGANLQLRTFIPGISLQTDGLITAAANLDQSLADTPTNVVLGPDSHATLSFTSGSTGIPKGVKGRHYSLTHFFPWMSERFGLTENERFTMLSGIAHDPIQRDMFTPLFLGAELHVPTADDIGTPGRLAEWMADSAVTVTHLTPAMGQLLSAQATRQIPTLRNAFFVGDVLTKRDCHRLQALAQNVRIINMYGTTETQRAVSYFAIPPVSEDASFLQTQKDIMPAGQGMIDVQLLVVNRADRNIPCAVGEMGEIYVRSGGLAEGYLDESATQEKFVLNWFGSDIQRPDTLKDSNPAAAEYWKGIRDRMYRSGDLGRYLPNGTVECTGRADDQIKIRGFRIELGEIDTHLSRHPKVRENVTLVRRDKDEEKLLVSYFVPNGGDELISEDEDGDEDSENTDDVRHSVARGIRRYHKLIKDIKEHLKKKLPSYSVPTVFIPMNRMPLNPNGKIDKPALPFPDTALHPPRPRKSKTEMTATQQAIADIWAGLLTHATSIDLQDNFFDLGGHSILATRMIFELRKAFVMELPLGLVFEQPTIAGLASTIDGLKQNSVTGQQAFTADVEYAKDVDVLLPSLPSTFPPVPPKEKLTVFLTGATGFLGAFILRDLLALRESRVAKVIAHVRAKTSADALQRLRQSCSDRGVWDEQWVSDGRLEAVVGDLAQPRLGMSEQDWTHVNETADAVLHNGAIVHWVYPYAKLRAANVLSTVACLELCADSTHPKLFSFVSSTATVEAEYYVKKYDLENGLPETDDLEGSRTTLTTGYGQSKWVAEKLIMEAGRRGLSGWTVRPSYVVGDSKTAVTNTDDFLMRLIKGCIQLGQMPDINNTINMVPVDHVALLASLSAITAKPSSLRGLTVLQVTAHPKIRFNDFLSALPTYGYPVERVEYLAWRSALERHVTTTQDNALFPLLHYVLDDLPTSTKSAELDDTNSRALAKSNGEAEGAGVGEEEMGRYLAWLIATDFLPAPPAGHQGKALPQLEVTTRAVGRTTAGN